MADLYSLGTPDNSGLVHKYKLARAFIAPETAALPTAITSGATPTLSALLSGYVSLGMVTKDGGFEFSTDTSTSTVEALGYDQPVRYDIDSEEESVAFTMLEDKRVVREIIDRVDLSAVVPDATTGEVSYAKPLAGRVRYYRFLLIGVDGAGAREFFDATLYPRAMLSEGSKGTFSNDARGFAATLKATPDSVAGFASKVFLAGSGQKANNVAAGYAASA